MCIVGTVQCNRYGIGLSITSENGYTHCLIKETRKESTSVDGLTSRIFVVACMRILSRNMVIYTYLSTAGRKFVSPLRAII